jgi:hypothetical protein
MTVRLPLSIVLLLALRAGSCGAWEVSNRVMIEHGPLVIDHSKSVSEITKAQAKGGFPGGHGLGLFQSRMKTELAYVTSDVNTRRLSMTTRIVTTPVIYVAREFPESSCAYGVILGHERQHQLFDLEVLRAMPGEIRGITRTVYAPDALDWMRKLDLDRLRNRFFKQYKYVYDGLSFPRHQTIDNPASYRQLSLLCNGEFERRLAGVKPEEAPLKSSPWRKPGSR